MGLAAWITRLRTQLPNWHIIYASKTGSWYAVVRPRDMEDEDVVARGRTGELPAVGPCTSPEELRLACRHSADMAIPYLFPQDHPIDT